MQDAAPAMCVEGGGTHSRAALYAAADADGGFVADAGRCNPTTNLPAARESVEALWEQLAAKHGCARAETRLVLGCAGLVPEDVRAEFVGAFKDFKEVTPLSDGYVALVGAGGGKACGMIVAGTGCAGHRMGPDGLSLQRDGWGWIAGDRGSGAWIGLQALRHSLTVRDGLLPEDELAKLVLPDLGEDNAAIAGWFQSCEPLDIARFARHVFDRAAAGDALAEDILQRGRGPSAGSVPQPGLRAGRAAVHGRQHRDRPGGAHRRGHGGPAAGRQGQGAGRLRAGRLRQGAGGMAGSLSGPVLAPGGWLKGEVRWNDAGAITEINGAPAAAPPPGEARVVAGFVDLHVHGGGGFDAMEGADAVRGMASYHLRRGTVALAPTTMTAAPDDVAAALRGVAAARDEPAADAAAIVGAHLEGPFINGGCLGAQPPLTRDYDAELLAGWLQLGRIAVATVAVEIEGGMAMLAQLREAGCKVQLGHTKARREQVVAALGAGLDGFTHLYNAMSRFQHRGDSVAACALALARHAEVICDLRHVEAPALLAAWRAIPGLYAVTDSTAAAGQPDGPCRLGGQEVRKEGDRVLLADGGLAGTAMSMLDARRNLIEAGLDEVQAQEMVAERPAAYLGLDCGTVAPGKRADLLVLAGGELREVWLGGRKVEG